MKKPYVPPVFYKWSSRPSGHLVAFLALLVGEDDARYGATHCGRTYVGRKKSVECPGCGKTVEAEEL